MLPTRMTTARPIRSAEARARASAVPTAELARRRLAGEATPGPRIAAQGALRLGTPVEHRSDLYALLMGGSWARLSGAIALAYLVLNAVFAGLYLLEDGAIQNAAPGSFADAFFFSVQTFATIGYGGMTPRTPYANALVTVEAAVGLLTTALATGLMVAKAARPRSAALFSDCMVVTPRNGVPTLMFRVGNARGNDIVDASITVVALLEELTAEGEHMRRLVDVPLARSRTPIFGLTWTVVHPLDDSSPLRDADFTGAGHLVTFIVTLTGHDGTYGQTTYARRFYAPADVRVGHRFVDVMSQLPDGRMVIDYARFHDTEPVST